jgi:hypothetical protein
LRAEITAFLDAIENGSEVSVTGEEGKRAVSLAVGVLERIAEHRGRLNV